MNIPDQAPPGQTPDRWKRVDDLLTAIRESLRIAARQPEIIGDLAHGIANHLTVLTASAGPVSRARIDDLAEAVTRAAETVSPEVRAWQILAAREALARLDLLAVEGQRSEAKRSVR